MKKQPGRKKKGRRVIDLRGLTSEERQAGAAVKLSHGRYRVIEIDERAGVAILERDAPQIPPENA